MEKTSTEGSNFIIYSLGNLPSSSPSVDNWLLVSQVFCWGMCRNPSVCAHNKSEHTHLCTLLIVAAELGGQVSAGNDQQQGQLGALAAPGARPQLCWPQPRQGKVTPCPAVLAASRAFSLGLGRHRSSACLALAQGVLPDSAIQRPGTVWWSWNERLLWFGWFGGIGVGEQGKEFLVGSKCTFFFYFKVIS